MYDDFSSKNAFNCFLVHIHNIITQSRVIFTLRNISLLLIYVFYYDICARIVKTSFQCYRYVTLYH